MTIRKQLATWGTCIALLLAGMSPVHAASLQLRAYLNGAQVPNPSIHTGVGTMSFDTVTKQLSWSVAFSGLGSAFFAAHFHSPAAAGTDAAVSVPMSGTTSPLTGSATLNATQEAHLLAGQMYINIHSANFTAGEIRGQVRLVSGDASGDGRADIFWRNETSGQNAMWPMNGFSIVGADSPGTVPDLDWQVQGMGDFDGDGKADIFWKNTAIGQTVLWLMNGTAIAGSVLPGTVSDLDWVVQGVGDFDGNGKSDVLWKNHATGQVVVWLMDGGNIASSGSPGTVPDLDWQVQGVGDFDGDGKADVFWKNTTTGQTVVWLMSGGNIVASGSPYTVADLAWVVQGVGDFDGDGRSDVLWRNLATGQIVLWMMNGGGIVSTATAATVADQQWHVQQVADYNGDGLADILWRHAVTGQPVLWLMNGASILSQGSPGTVSDLLWTAQGPGARHWAARIGAQNAVNVFAQTLNSNGVNLAASHFSPLFSSGYLTDGFSATQDAGILAGDERDLSGASIAMQRLFRYDAVNQAAYLTATLSGTAPGPAAVSIPNIEQEGGLGFRRQSDGSWKLYGDQQPGELGVQTEMRTENYPNVQTGPRQHVSVDLRTLQGQYTAATISGGGLFNSFSVAKSTTTEVMTVQADPSPAAALTYLRDTWQTGAYSAIGNPATFTVTLTPVSGPALTRKVLSHANTAQFVTITNPTVHTLEAANLGSPLNVNWTLPSFDINRVRLSGRVRTATSPNPGFECLVDNLRLGAGATSGQVTLPNACNGQPILEAAISVAVDGSGGERTIYHFGFTPGVGLAPGAVALGSASTFGIMATSAITNTGNSVINGNVSLDPGTSMTGFPPGVVNGVVHINDTQSAQARIDLLNAYNSAKELPPGTTISGGADLGALYLSGMPPGTYTSGSTMKVLTPLVLDAGGNANAVWVFQIGSSLTTEASVTLTNNAQSKNVFWVPTEDATIGVGTIFHGTIVSGRDVTAVTGATINGRILAGAINAGTIALQGATINVPAP